MDTTMKFISWNVNGLRACMQKGFLDFFNEVDADFFCVQETKLQEGQIALGSPNGYRQILESVSRRQNYRRGRLPLISPATISSGIMPKKKAIPALLFLQNTNHSLSLMASASRSMTMRGVSSHWNTMLFIWLPVTLRIPRTNWQDFLTACSGKKIFLPF